VRSRHATLWIAALAGLLALATSGARGTLGAEAALVGRVRDPSWLPDGKALRLASFGNRLLVSDLYWLQTVQYIGEGFENPDRGWEALRPLVEIVTDLDPRHGYAYYMTALCLADPARRYGDAYAVLDKGMKALPDRYSLPLLYGQVKFIYEKDLKGAGEYIRRAAVVGKRPYLALLAGTLAMNLDEAEEYRVAAAFIEETIPQAQEPHVRKELEERLVRVRTYETLSRTEKAIARYREAKRRLPATLRELVAEGFLPALPEDPSGGQIRYSPIDGKVESTVLGPRKPFP
jgi:tetratricopeptide (TPR) repeat protein